MLIVLLYLVGLACLLATFLPFSPMTIDVVNLRRETQLAIYRQRRRLWAAAGAAWAVALVLGLGGAGGSDLDAGRGVVVIGVSVALMGMAFWTGYVPIVMAPPGRTRRFRGAEAAQRVAADDVVLGVAIEGEACAYLRDQIARPHYLVDRVGGRDLVISYCILCNSATAFAAELDGKRLDLRCVTAYNNNIIYVDRASGNFIQQLDARVIAGPAAGTALTTVPVTVARWADWRALYPESALLDAPPQSIRDRLVARMLEFLIPVPKLVRRTRPWHRIQGMLDPRLGAMSLVIGVERDGDAAAYDIDTLRREGVIDDAVGGMPIALFADRDHDIVNVFERRSGARVLSFSAFERGHGDASAVARDHETGSLWNATGRALEGPLCGSQLPAVPHFNKLFWFSWALFKPHVRLHQAQAS